MHMVVKRNSCTASMDRTVSIDRMASADVAVAKCMGERGVTEKEQEERFRSILMPRGPRGCMRGCENAGTTCFIGREHTSARNVC